MNRVQVLPGAVIVNFSRGLKIFNVGFLFLGAKYPSSKMLYLNCKSL